MGRDRPSGERFEPVPLSVHLDGEINDEWVTVDGVGSVATVGVYEATFNFDPLPESFHPTLSSILVLKCVALAAMRGGARNITRTGADGYETRRALTLEGDAEGTLEAEGEVTVEGGLDFDGHLSGDLRLPDDLAGSSMFVQRLTPHRKGRRITGPGVGSTFRVGGEGIPIELEEETDIEGDLAAPWTDPVTRIVTESGTLEGRTYRTVVHSILDAGTSFTDVVERA